jgi:hypothetical protein
MGSDWRELEGLFSQILRVPRGSHGVVDRLGRQFAQRKEGRTGAARRRFRDLKKNEIDGAFDPRRAGPLPPEKQA